MNKVILIGNVGSTPEVKALDNGLKVATFSLATSETFTAKNGEKTTQTEWHRVEAWNGLASVTETHIQKGDRLCIEGKIKNETWEDRDGNKRTTVKILLQRVELLGKKREQVEAQSKPTAKGKSKKSKVAFEEGGEGDLPF